MKFSRSIEAQMFNEWKEEYIDYNGLKKLLASDQDVFMSGVQVQLNKANQFYNTKTQELVETLRTLTVKAKNGVPYAPEVAQFGDFNTALNHIRVWIGCWKGKRA